MKLDKEQVKLSEEWIAKDYEEIQERLGLVSMVESKHTTADFLYCVDMQGMDSFGNVLLVQHKVNQGTDICLELDKNKLTEGGYSLHLGKATHLVMHYLPKDMPGINELYIFDTRLLQRAFDTCRQSFKLKAQDGHQLTNKEKRPICFIGRNELLQVYGMTLEYELGASLDRA